MNAATPHNAAISRAEYDPDSQQPMPFAAADDYARTVMRWAREPLPDTVDVIRDIPYGAHRLHRYDVHLPRGALNAPVLVFWHGGGWTNGYRQYQHFMAPHVAALGMLMVSPSYRLAPEWPLPCAHEDSLQMLADLQRRLPQWGGAPDQVYLAGHSAGAHLATLATLRSADRAAAGLNPHMIRGCLPISGAMDLHDPAPTAGSLEERVYTMVLRGREAHMDTLMSPLYWCAGNTVPFVLCYGEHDSARAIKSNQRLFAMLQAQGAPVSCHMEPGRDHFQTHTALRDGSDPWYARLAGLIRGSIR